MKRKNNYTGKAIHNLTDNAIQLLYDGDFTYIQYEERYLERRFHSTEYLQELHNKQHNHLVKFGHSNIEQTMKIQSKQDRALQRRFNDFTQKYNGDRPLLVLDVDNTMLCARFFAEEIRIGDHCTYFSSSTVQRNNATVTMIQQTLTLIINNNELIDVLGTETVKHAIWINNNNQLTKRYKDNDEIFFYEMMHPIDTELQIKIPCKVSRIQITGCKIYVVKENKEIQIDFTRKNEDLRRLEPCLDRPGFIPVDFVYEGFLIRIRPNLDEFLESINDEFNVCLFTAAKHNVYKGLLETLHEYVKEQIGRENDTDLRLWSDVLFRNDCTLKYDLHNKPYHHKDLTLFGCDLSRVVMVDNSPIVLHKEEPNSIFIKDFFGKNADDDELMSHVYPLLEEISEIKGDIRYFLCSLYQDGSYVDTLDLSTEDQCRSITQTFINFLKFNAPSQQIEFLLSEPIYTQRSTVPISSNTNSILKKRKRRATDPVKAQTMHNKPLLKFENDKEYERNIVYSSMSTKVDDKFDFDIENTVDDDDIKDTKRVDKAERVKFHIKDDSVTSFFRHRASLINYARIQDGKPSLGFLNPVLYKLYD